MVLSRCRGGVLLPYRMYLCTCVHAVPGCVSSEATEEGHVNQRSSRSARCSVPTRLVTSGPLLLSLQNTHTHTHAQAFSRLYIVLYSVAIIDLHTMGIFFNGCCNEEHANPHGLNDMTFIRQCFRSYP